MARTHENHAFARETSAEREPYVLLAMQNVEGSNPFATSPDHATPRTGGPTGGPRHLFPGDQQARTRSLSGFL
jgi:hypothetical protein